MGSESSGPRDGGRAMSTASRCFLRARTILALPRASLGLVGAAHSQPLRDDFWVTNGSVEAVAVDNGIVYLGGSFSRVGPAIGGAAMIDAAGSVLQPYLQVIGKVEAI